MTTALAFDLFLDEHDILLDNELFTHINGKVESCINTPMKLSVVKNDNSEIKINNHKAENDFSENEIPEIKSLFNKAQNENPKNEISNFKDSFFQNQNVTFQSLNSENENPENEIEFAERVRKEMIKGYMSLLSN